MFLGAHTKSMQTHKLVFFVIRKGWPWKRRWWRSPYPKRSILSPFVSIILPYLWLSLLTLPTFTKNKFATWGMFIKVYRHVLFCCFTLCLVFLRCFLLYTPLFLKCSTFTLHSPLLTSLSSVCLSLKLLILSSQAGEMKYMKTRPQ